VGLVLENAYADENSEKAIRPNGGEVGESAHGEQVDDFLAGHSCFGEEQAVMEFGSLIVSCFLYSPA
jgi:hypothetical protein